MVSTCPFVVLDNRTPGGFQLLSYFTARLFDIFIVIYRRDSIIDGRDTVSQFHDQTTSRPYHMTQSPDTVPTALWMCLFELAIFSY
jgi:hypothetical protein